MPGLASKRSGLGITGEVRKVLEGDGSGEPLEGLSRSRIGPEFGEATVRCAGAETRRLVSSLWL